MPDAPRRTWPPDRSRESGDPNRPNWTAARNAARHLAEGWAIEAAQQRRLAEEYADHVRWLGDALRALQRSSGAREHSCSTCTKAAESASEAEAHPPVDDEAGDI